MSLLETTYAAPDGTEYAIVCEEPASGLEGIDGEAWRFRIKAEGEEDHLVVRGISEALLEQWEATDSDTRNPGNLIELLAHGIKADLKGVLVTDIAERVPRRVLEKDGEPDTFAEAKAQAAAAA